MRSPSHCHRPAHPTNQSPKRYVVDLKVINLFDLLCLTECVPLPFQERWVNKQRVLVFASRGISHRDRHLMRDIKTLMPHHREESKMERTKTLSVVNEMCTMKNCNKALLFEGRRKMDLYMWCSNIPNGPSIKFLVENIHTMGELKMTGNCLRGARPMLSFDSQFTEIPHLKIIKELFTQMFGVPNYHPKSQPFFDHVYTFAYIDKRIWFRNFQILSEDGGLAEIGPRFVLNPVKLFRDSFSGPTLWENPTYVSPARYRQMVRKAASSKYEDRIDRAVQREVPIKTKKGVELDDGRDVFCLNPEKKAKGIVKKEAKKQLEKGAVADEEESEEEASEFEGEDDDEQEDDSDEEEGDDDEDMDDEEEDDEEEDESD